MEYKKELQNVRRTVEYKKGLCNVRKDYTM